METYRIEIQDKRVEKILDGLAEMQLIKILKEKDPAKPAPAPKAVRKNPIRIEHPNIKMVNDMRNIINNIRDKKS